MMGRKLNETLDFSQNNYLLGTANRHFNALVHRKSGGINGTKEKLKQ